MQTTSITDVQELRDALAVADAGRKAANLSLLLRRGFPVPDGVVVTASALDRARAASGSATPDVPSDVADAVRLAVSRWPDTPLAVRSSGIDEDLDDASYAGLYTTVLNVEGADAVLSAVGTCWASATADRVSAYRDDVSAARMAVLIQPMVAVIAAGVAFTADPVTGARDVVVVEAVPGLGEDLVSGAATPERWVVRGAEAGRRSGAQPVVTTDQALAVAGLARRVAAELGGPHDIEWAIDAAGVALLQARPITKLPQPPLTPVPVPADPPPGFWTREASHAPVPVSPFCRVPMARRNVHLAQMCTDFAFLFDGIEFREIGGWEYVRVVPLGGRDPKPMPAWLSRAAFAAVPVLRRRVRQSAAAMRADVASRMLDRWRAEWQPEMDRQIAALRDVDLALLTDEALDAHTTRVLDLLDHGLAIHFRLHGAIALVLADIAFTCRDLLGWDDARTFDLLAGLSVTSTEPSRALTHLAGLEGTRFEEAFVLFQRTHGGRALRYEVAEENLEERPDLIRSLIADQRQSGFDLTPTDQALVTRRARRLNDARSQLKDDGDRARFDAALTRAVEAYPVREDNGFWTVSVPLGLLRRAALEIGRRLAVRGQIGDVDDVFFLEPGEARAAVRDGGAAHDTVARRKGERTWVLAHPGPTTYGTEPPPPPLEALRGLARLSVESFLWTTDRIFGDARAVASSTPGVVRGVPASRGSYTGTVRVVMDEAGFSAIRQGDVLVCPVTSPVWSVLFPSIGALVTESGGTLSHPAIIAREYGIPAVVNTQTATTALRNGQLVKVDGDAGVVQVLG